MVAPLIAAGARIIGKRAAAKTAARRSAKRGVQNSARHTASASPRTPSAYARTGRTVPHPFEEDVSGPPAPDGVQNAKRRVTNRADRSAKAREVRRKQPLPHRDNLGKKVTRILRNRVLARSAQENNVSGKIESIKEKIHVFEASEAILSWYIPFYLWFQLPCVILTLIALAYEGFLDQISWGLLNFLSPGEGLFYVGMGLMIAFGIIAMGVAAATYTFRYISVFSGNMRLGGMIICTALHFIPAVNLFPWIGVWIAIVIWSYR